MKTDMVIMLVIGPARQTDGRNKKTTGGRTPRKEVDRKERSGQEWKKWTGRI